MAKLFGGFWRLYGVEHVFGLGKFHQLYMKFYDSASENMMEAEVEGEGMLAERMEFEDEEDFFGLNDHIWLL